MSSHFAKHEAPTAVYQTELIKYLTQGAVYIDDVYSRVWESQTSVSTETYSTYIVVQIRTPMKSTYVCMTMVVFTIGCFLFFWFVVFHCSRVPCICK